MRLMRFRARIFLSSAILIIITTSLGAHPHMWISGELFPEVGRRGLESVRVIWNMDEMTSSTLILDYDNNGNGVLDSREVETLRQQAFEHLIESEYYLLVEIGDMLASPGRAEDFTARIENGHIVYGFRVPLLIPVRWDDIPDVSVFLFDQSYFIDFRPEELQGSTSEWNDQTVEFTKMSKRSMTRGYGLIDLIGLQVSGVTSN